MTDALAVLDREGRILYTNASWGRASAAGAIGGAKPGASYLEVCERAAARDADSALVLRGLRSVLAGAEPRFMHQCRRRTRGGGRWQTVTISALPGAGRGAVIVWTDTTTERTAQRQVRALSRMLLTAHERERQAIARELHDDITQVLAATAIDLSLLPPRVAPAPDEVRTAIAKTAERLRKLSNQVQALSHRMHPHALRALGLARALEGECRAFAARTGIGMTTSIRAGKVSLSPRIALAAFRIGQEALNNVRKHARAASVRVELDQSPDELRLSIKDTGVGFDRSTGRPGIGLVGMKERALSVGGRIAISSVRGRGTGVTLTVPLGRGRA